MAQGAKWQKLREQKLLFLCTGALKLTSDATPFLWVFQNWAYKFLTSKVNILSWQDYKLNLRCKFSVESILVSEYCNISMHINNIPFFLLYLFVSFFSGGKISLVSDYVLFLIHKQLAIDMRPALIYSY